MRGYLIPLALVVATAAITAGVIYLTPLKWINVIAPTYHDVDPKAFEAEYQANPGQYIFLDVRQNAAYATLHASGSTNMPLQTLYDTRTALPKSGETIVLICSNGQASGVGYMYLQHYGFFNIERVAGGVENWVSEGMPVEGTSVPTSAATSSSQ
jgi:rhodanese-related sulfurtransferase